MPGGLVSGFDGVAEAHVNTAQPSTSSYGYDCFNRPGLLAFRSKPVFSRRVTNRTLLLSSFACWCEQDQVATVLETCVMKVGLSPDPLRMPCHAEDCPCSCWLANPLSSCLSLCA